jgi:predicted phage tail protein
MRTKTRKKGYCVAQVAQGKLRQLLVTMCGVLTLVAAYFHSGYGTCITGTWGGLLLFFGLRSMLSAGGVAWHLMASRREFLRETEDSSLSINYSNGRDNAKTSSADAGNPQQLAPA